MDSERPVEIVAFDAGLTLLRAQPSALHVLADGLKRAGIEVPEEDLPDWGSAYHVAWTHHDETWRGAGHPDPHIGDPEVERLFWSGLYKRLLADMHIEGDHETIADHIHDGFRDPNNWGPYPEAIEVLDALAAAGLRTALLSNWNPQLRAILDTHDMTDRFEQITISGEIGVTKPAPEIFRHLLSALGESPGPHIAYVGDDLAHDIEPSIALGLRAVLVDRDGRRPEHDGARVSDLRQLPEVIPLARRVTFT